MVRWTIKPCTAVGVLNKIMSVQVCDATDNAALKKVGCKKYHIINSPSFLFQQDEKIQDIHILLF